METQLAIIGGIGAIPVCWKRAVSTATGQEWFFAIDEFDAGDVLVIVQAPDYTWVCTDAGQVRLQRCQN